MNGTVGVVEIAAYGFILIVGSGLLARIWVGILNSIINDDEESDNECG